MKKIWVVVGLALLSLVGLAIYLTVSVAEFKCRCQVGLEWLSCISSPFYGTC